MISLDIHVGILMEIMELESSDTLTVKASQVQLLINKCPNFFMELAEQNQ